MGDYWMQSSSPLMFPSLYEVKVADTTSQVVRKAMGQLLEYGFREGGLKPEKLFVVEEPDAAGRLQYRH